MHDEVTTLSLKGNNFYKNIKDELIQIFAAIPVKVTHLDLADNGFGESGDDRLAQALKNIPANVTKLGLEDSGFCIFPEDRLIQTLKAIPAHVTSLSLADNNMGDFYVGSLADALAAIPNTVTSLDLSCNQLNDLSIESINDLINPLSHVETIYLSASEITAMDLNMRNALKVSLSGTTNIILIENNGSQLGGDNPRAQHFYAASLGITQQPADLRSLSAFFVAHNADKATKSMFRTVDEDDIEFLEFFKPPKPG